MRRKVSTIRNTAAGQDHWTSWRALLPDELTSGKAYGYRFRMRATTTSYGIQADPLAGRDRSFDSDQTMIVRTSTGNPIR